MQTEPANTDRPKRKRRWFQFSLRTLLIFMLVCAVACAWLGRKIERKRQEREAVKAIFEAGGYALYDHQAMNWDTEPPGPKWLRAIAGENLFSEVESVAFAIPGTAISDETMANLKVLTRLNTLTLPNTRFSRACLIYLEPLNQLRSLDLGMTSISDDDLEHLGGSNKLESLYLYQTDITDSGLTCLEKLTNLQNLDLRMTKVSDAGLIRLKGLRRLQSLDLSLTSVSDAAAADLQKALPSCKIKWGRLW